MQVCILADAGEKGFNALLNGNVEKMSFESI
jgi:hypothetical protein